MRKPGLSFVTDYVKKRYTLIIWSIWIVLAIELFDRRDIASPFLWLISHPASFVLNVLGVLGLTVLLGALIGSARAAYWVVTGLGLVLALISGVKLKMLGVPLLPWDLAVAGEGGDMVKYVKNIVTAPLVVGLLVFMTASYFLLYRLPHSPKKLNWRERGVWVIVSLALLGFLWTDKPVPLWSMLHITDYADNQGENVRANGYLLATMMNLDGMHVGKPDGYNAKAIAAIAGTLPVAEAAEIKPNIIVVLSESFFDPTQIPSLTFSRDPLPFFHQIQRDYTSGTILTPQYGGGTANVEFEVLTGNSMRFLPQGSIAYNQFINKPTDSLASILHREGYTSTAINPFHNWFFNSNKVYQDFGFGKFISIEFFNPIYNGPYIADSEVANNIIRSTEESQGPDFVFANTMENHFHYYPGKFKENTIGVTGVTGESQGMIETYAQGLIGADNMLKALVNHYSQSKEPTILLWFGDHLPYLGDNYQFYKDAKYITGEDDPDFLNKIYRTPVLIWDNYLPQHKETLDFSPSFLSPYVLRLAGRPGTYYTDYLSQLSKKIPVIPPKDYYAQMNIQESDLQQYETLQYDILFGQQHGYEGFKDKIIDPSYHLGYAPIQLDQAQTGPPASSGETTVTVHGSYLPAQCVLYANGKPLATSWNGQPDTLEAKLPAELANAGTVELKAKLADSKQTIVGESNTLTLKLAKQG